MAYDKSGQNYAGSVVVSRKPPAIMCSGVQISAAVFQE